MYILVFIICILINLISVNNNYINNSKLAYKIINNTPILSNITSNITNSINEIRKSDDKKSKEEILKTLLEYKIISKKELTNLYKSKKIDSLNLDIIN